jgi:hypothetical protein
MEHSPPPISTSFGFGRADRRPTRVDYGVLVCLFAAVVVLAMLALGVSSSSLLHDDSCVRASDRSSCQAPSAVESPY